MLFRILGLLQVQDQGRTIPLAGAKQRSLLALLLRARGQGGPRPTTLIDEVWAGSPRGSALKSIQVYVSQLRAALGEGRVVTHRRGYALIVAPGRAYADRSNQRVRVGVWGRAGGCGRVASMRRLALFRGDPLSDLSLEPWAQPGDCPAGGDPARGARGSDRCGHLAGSPPRARAQARRTRRGTALSASISWSNSCSRSIAPGGRPRLSTRSAAGRPSCGTSSASTRAAHCRSSTIAHPAPGSGAGPSANAGPLAAKHAGGAGRLVLVGAGRCSNRCHRSRGGGCESRQPPARLSRPVRRRDHRYSRAAISSPEIPWNEIKYPALGFSGERQLLGVDPRTGTR